jgi:hypothetical protein
VRAADLGFCAPSGTRTPNPLKLAARLLVASAIALICPLTWAFTALTTLALPRHFGRFRADGGGVKRGLLSVSPARMPRSQNAVRVRAPPGPQAALS